ncbi:uncharacterized protein LOC128246541 [Mya arenaria]|uniref:uncharacterized protein LOC128246541 n=1 Tax=Mya arenaria TaxID=6604 RepID=UPI0022E98446|nr:uncharacterized protein LOC128246541 [Mya arenaria]XP_052820763.1 uncharacterized protein LOC128246541 [Mya arenaria]
MRNFYTQGALLLVFAVIVNARAASSCQGHTNVQDNFCWPGQTCMPTHQDILDFAASLDGDIITPTDERYPNVTIMINTRVTMFPYVVVMAESVDDVIKTVKFANKFNVKLTIRSSGHDYIGRSTGDGTLQLNLEKMKGLEVKLNSTRNADGELKAQSGNAWMRVYTELNKFNRTVIGGSSPTVAIGGFTLGGGHSPIGRKFGLAIDNLLEVEMVTANGSLVYATETETVHVDPDTGARSISQDTDIFWALRGGGGATFGIVTAFTYKIHKDSRMVRLACISAFKDANGNDVGRLFLKTFNDLLSTTLAPEWGGYQILSAKGSPIYHTPSGVFLYLNHFGEWGSPSFHTIDPFLNKYRGQCQLDNRTDFLDYEKDTKDALYTNSYVFSTFMQPGGFTDDFYDFTYDMLLANHSGLPIEMGCTGTLIGGHMNDVQPDTTAMNPSMRTGVMCLTCGGTWDPEKAGLQPEEDLAAQFGDRLLTYGQGTYFNEPSAHLPNWKTDYWGGHYDRLLSIKRQWDPDHVFTCLHCVGSDMNRPFAQTPQQSPALVG